MWWFRQSERLLLRPDRTMELKDWKGKGCMMRDSPTVSRTKSAGLRLSSRGQWRRGSSCGGPLC